MALGEILYLYNTGSTNGQDGKIFVYREGGGRQRVWLHHGSGLDMLRSEVKAAVDIAIANPNAKVNCRTLELDE